MQCVFSELRTEFYIPEYGILHSHRRKSLKSYIELVIFAAKIVIDRLSAALKQL
jgi:hypothetical protein